MYNQLPKELSMNWIIEHLIYPLLTWMGVERD